MRKQFTSRRAETNEVKKALAAADINAVVSQGKGTAYSWINVNIGSGSQWGEHERDTNRSFCSSNCVRCINQHAMKARAIEIVQAVTGRGGEYQGNISLMMQDGWNDKTGSFEILHPNWKAPTVEVQEAPAPLRLVPDEPKKIKATEIEIARVEGMCDECVTVIIRDSNGDCDLWAASDRILKAWAMSAPATGGYDKCDFTVRFADGETYSGRFDLQHKHMTERDLLAGHILGLADFYLGNACPGHMQQNDYAAFVANQPEIAESYKAFTSAYAVGVAA